jgi:hypothetical protein
MIARLANGRLFSERDPFAARVTLWEPEYGRSDLAGAA